MAEWSYEYQGYPNPQLHAAIERIRRKRAVRRARHCVDIPPEERVKELLAVGLTQREAADIMGKSPPEKPPLGPARQRWVVGEG
jgi:hypothetical protein